MKKLFIIAILALFAFTAYSQKPVADTTMKEYVVKYQEVSDTLNTIAIVFENDYMKKVPVKVIFKTTAPVRLYEDKIFLNAVGVPIKPESIFMFLLYQKNGAHQWMTP